MAKLGAAVDYDPFEEPASSFKLGAPVDFDPFGPPDEKPVNFPKLSGTPVEGIPLPPVPEREPPLPTPRPTDLVQDLQAQDADKLSAWERTKAAIGDIPEALARGYYGAKSGANILALEAGQLTPEEAAAGIAASEASAKENAMPESVRKGMEAFQKAKGWKESLNALAEHPDVLPSVLGESAASSLVSTGTGLVGALTGAVAGSVVPVVGTAAGATAGLAAGVGAGSAATEYASTLNEFLTSQGIDTSDPEQLKAAFSNPDLMAAARKDAVIRGVAVGAFDALTAGIAGKLFAPVKKALGKGAVGAVAGTAAEIGSQAAGGAGGEAAAQLGTKGEITSPSDILLEAAGEVIPGLGEVAVSKVAGASPSAKPEIAPEVAPEVAPEAPAGQPSPEQPVEAPGAVSLPPPEAAPEAAPTFIPADDDIAILKGYGYDIEAILGMSPSEIKAEVRDAKEAQAAPEELTPEDRALIDERKPARLGEPINVPVDELIPPAEAAPEAAPTPEAPPIAPATKATELVQQGVPPIEAMKEAGAEPIEPAPAAPVVEAAPSPVAELPLAPPQEAAPEIAPAPVEEAAPQPELEAAPIEPATKIPRIAVDLPFALKGGETEVKVGDTYIPARYAVVDAGDLKATLGKAVNQFRDRERTGSQGQIEKIANAPDWNQLNAAPVMDFGSPTLDRNGLIVGGNGRFEGLSRAYDRGSANRYRSLLQKNSGQFGIDPTTFAKMKKPVLMRIIEADVDTKKLALASNEGAGLRMSMLEQAKVDSERLPDLGGLRVGDNGEISAAGNRDLIRNWTKEMPATEIGGIVDADGALSQEGLVRLRNAIMHKAYGDSPTLGRIIESLDQGSKNIAAALIRSAPRSARAKEMIASGDLHNVNIVDDILDAADKFEQLRANGEKVGDYLAQGQMFGSDISPESRKILQFFGDHMRSAKTMSELFNKYWDKVEAAGSPKQAGIFGEETVPTKAELLDAALKDSRKVAPAAEAELPFGEAEAAPAPEVEAAPAPAPEVEEVSYKDERIKKALESKKSPESMELKFKPLRKQSTHEINQVWENLGDALRKSILKHFKKASIESIYLAPNGDLTISLKDKSYTFTSFEDGTLILDNYHDTNNVMTMYPDGKIFELPEGKAAPLKDVFEPVANAKELKPNTADKTLVLMACGGNKLKTNKAVPLNKLYTGPMWQTFREHKGSIGEDQVLVLSGKYGLVPGTKESMPYEETITEEKINKIAKDGVDPSILGGKKYDQVIIAGGGLYRKGFNAIVNSLKEQGALPADVKIVETTGGIGSQRGDLGNYLRQVNGGEKAAVKTEGPITLIEKKRINLGPVEGFITRLSLSNGKDIDIFRQKGDGGMQLAGWHYVNDSDLGPNPNNFYRSGYIGENLDEAIAKVLEKQNELAREGAAPAAEKPAPVAEKVKPAPKIASAPPYSFNKFVSGDAQFSKSLNMPQEYLDILAEWATMLGIKGKIHLMLNGKDTANFDFSPYRQKRSLSSKLEGERIYYKKENVSIIRMKLHPRKSLNLEVLAHELGHTFEIETWENASKEEKEAVMADYKKFLKENKDVNAEDYIRALRSHVFGKLTKISPSFRKLRATTTFKDPYWRSFNEYFADQVAKYMVSEERPQSVVGKYFARIAEGLKRLYNSLAGQQGKARKSMKEYIERRVNAADNILDGEVSAIETAAAAEEVVDEARSTVSQETIDEINELNKQTGMPKDVMPEQPQGPEETSFDKLRANIQDDKTFVEKVQRHIEKIRKAPLPDFLNVYARLMLMPGRISERIHSLNQREIKPFFEKMKELKVTPDELHKYRLALHAKERNARMAKVNPEEFGNLDGGGSGLTNGAAEILLERAEPRKKELNELNDMLTKILDNDLKRRVEAGLISQDQADGYKAMYENYVPLRGFAERDFEEDFAHQKYNLGKGISLSKDEYKKAMGRNSLSDNVVFNALMQAEEGIYRIEKNRAAKTLYNLARKFDFPDLWKVGKAKSTREIGSDGMVKNVLEGGIGPNTIVVKIGGQPYYVDLVNPALAAAFGRTGAITMAKWFRPIALLTRGFSQMLTSKNPAFMATNFNRDLAEAINYTFAHDPELMTGLMKNLPKAAVIATKSSWSDLTPAERKIYDQFRESGAKISFNAISDTEGHNKEWEKYVPLTAPNEWRKLPNATKKAAERAFHKVIDSLEKMTTPFEDSIRAAVFMSARDIMKPSYYKLTAEQRSSLTDAQKESYRKYSVDKAARFAQEATINFYRKGKWSPYLNGLYAFFNASTQGSATALRLLVNSKNARLAFMSMVPLNFMLTLRNLELSDDDPFEKGRKNYNNIPEWQRENSIIIKTGKGQKDYFRIRLPAVLSVPWYLGEQAALVMTGQQKASKAVGNVLGNAVNAFNPFGSNSIVGAITPTLLDPYADILVNKKFSGAPIHPKPEPWNVGIPNSDQAFATTAPWASTLTKTIYKGTAGAVDIYPGDAEHVISWMFSGLGKNAGNVVSFMNDIRQGKDAKIEDLPIVKTFAPTTWSPSARYYELHGAADSKVNVLRDKAKELVKAPSAAKYKEFNDLASGTGIYFDGEKANTSGASVLKAMRNTDSVLKELRQSTINVQNDPKLTPRAKQKKIDDIKLQMERAMVAAGQEMSIFDPRPSFAPLSSWIKK